MKASTHEQSFGVRVLRIACLKAELEYFLDLMKSKSRGEVGCLDSAELGIRVLIAFGDFNLG